jgi:hypothetical protein
MSNNLARAGHNGVIGLRYLITSSHHSVLGLRK